jgi:predicted phage tail protein
MTLIIQKPTGAKLNLRKTWQPMDPDAAAYITAVETADTEPLEEKTKIAIDNFVLGCKEDGIWTAIKASCILAGARTLDGALVPLVGTAPTNVGGLFVSGDYNRKTGLVGNGSTKYLDSNRNNNADPQNSKHVSVWVSTAATTTQYGADIGAYLGPSFSDTYLGRFDESVSIGVNSVLSVLSALSSAVTGFRGLSRSISSSYIYRASTTNNTISSSSGAPSSGSILVFSASSGFGLGANARLAFYSIGEYLDLALLDARVTDLITAIGAAF